MKYYTNVYLLYGIAFFHNLIPAYVIERLFWQERGMNVLMVVFCEIIYAGTIVLAEIPTGILADKMGRKLMMLIGALLSFLEIVILLFAHDFWAFGLAVFLAGIATSCTSGSANALLYDTLLIEKSEKSFEKVLGRINSLDLIAAILAALSGSVLAIVFNFEFNYIISAGSMLIALVLSLLLVEPSKDISEKNINNEINQEINSYLKEAILFFKERPKLLSIIIHAMAIAACITYLDEFWQLYLDEIEVPILFFGLFSAGIILARIPGNLLASYFVSKFKTEVILLVVLVITTIGFFLLVAFPGPFGIVMIMLIFLASGVVDPVVTGYLHHHCNSQIRATVDSFQSLFERSISLTIGICFGFISTKLSLLAGFFLLGVVCFLFLFSFLCLAYKEKKAV